MSLWVRGSSHHLKGRVTAPFFIPVENSVAVSRYRDIVYVLPVIKRMKYKQTTYRATEKELVLVRKLAKKLKVSQAEVIRKAITLLAFNTNI